jgi:hypothetical protein
MCDLTTTIEPLGVRSHIATLAMLLGSGGSLLHR